MKKILFTTLAILVTGLATFAQSGDVMSTTHNVYSGITHTYRATGTDGFTWEVFSDLACNEASAVASSANTYTFTGTTNTENDLTITWNEPAVSPTTYYLRLKQLNTTTSCYNYKTLTVVVSSVNNMTFAFTEAATNDCAVNISGSDVVLDVNLVGSLLVHDATNRAQIQYAIGTGDKEWLDVDLADGVSNAGAYTITIPANELFSTNAETAQDFAINVYQLRDGNGAVNNFTASPITHTWTATALPTIVDIEF